MKHSRSRASLAGLAIIGLGATMTLGACSKDEDTVASDCKPKHENIKTVKDGTLTVGTLDILPWASYNNGDPEGIDVGIAKQIAKDNCLNLNWEQTNVSDSVQSIQGGKLDMAIGCINRTKAREKAVDFSATTYLDGTGIASKAGYKTVKDLEKNAKKVGGIDGYLWVDDMKKILGKRLQTYPSSVELKADFDAGRLDAAVDSYGTIEDLYGDIDGVSTALANADPDKRVGALVQAPQAAFPMAKGNTSLKEAAGDSIAEQREDGTIEKLLKDKGLSKELMGTQEEVDEAYSVPDN